MLGIEGATSFRCYEALMCRASKGQQSYTARVKICLLG
jgi:hypothetical protein